MVDPMQLRRAFGAQLRHSRLASGISQEELAYRTGMHRTYISLLERGARTPSLDIVFRLCEALGQPPEDFIATLRRGLLK
jgi:transcriptional regulator with XRE-family HTH domain